MQIAKEFDFDERVRVFMQVVVKDNKGSKPEDEPPPMWFRSYMEKVTFHWVIHFW